ncbi:aminoglycoside phosphotransferase (APT) family kinase protein [Pseudonocardia sediminis]|uniref:Aminoglycoside phosphotransferase (APT) family kinase protein n=1 Tax=Pseudonocardia sediminis TaxID=1397368 RepID=A0A4Q7V091_PSEST|nr:phosphotransferase family protein [Pseudonocardia sediminis]RZT86711.1 aminoglycoside phosphotransferase (APT) family kinase protein [Pseudonocardia sediminis]
MTAAVDRDRLGAFLRTRGLVDGPVTARPIGDGHSNLTYLVSDGTRAVVVRRPPPPPTPPGAHDVLREAMFVHALAGSGVPVPRVLATAEAGDLFDVPCYVMTFVDGPVVTTATPEALASSSVRRGIGESMVDTLAALHAVDRAGVGLGEAGRPEGFNARHLKRMRRLVAGPDGALPDGFADVDAWLERHVPSESGAAIVHNDFRLGNLVIAPSAPGRVAAVLDWELATVGDPLLDVAYLLASYPQPGEPLVPTAEMATAVLEDGWPARDELAARYAAATGRDLSGLGWYTTMVLFKLAVLYEYSRRQGTDPYYADPSLVRSFLDAAHRAT